MTEPPHDTRPSFPARIQIRELAARNAAAQRAAAKRGENVQQLVLDQADANRAFATQLGASEGSIFLVMYAEEMAAINHDTAGRNALTDRRAKAFVAIAFTLIVAAVVYFVVRASIR